ncbi:MAG: bifunctional adenosylcobinamide kinase/adenosylcobinamide-phosphate guanylyltransferase [Clostridia bacterium]|nr:bifunctional adenosylcobinamide kinase/adenosylcobinamide-phosphate guanylyltransferase [Clostridia bacterium]
MILILGGAASGKRTYLASLGYAPEEVADGVLDDRKVLYGLEKLVAADPEGAAALLPALLHKEAVVCCEVGSGVIPIRYEQRQAREATGRLCVQLAARSEKVIRLVAGIPIVIKGE